jgi:photosystem II stability/assembly factor-like uncharacterized protein
LSTAATWCEPWVQVGPEGGTIGALAYAASDPRVAFAATDPWFSLGASRIFRSSNGGSTWSSASEGLPLLAVLSLAIDPTRVDVVYLGTDDGVWKTTNGGTHWTRSPGPLAGQRVTALAIDARHPSRLYAGTTATVDTSSPGAIYRSDDGAASWTAASRGLPPASAAASIVALSVDPEVVDAVVAPPYWPARTRVHRIRPRRRQT